MFSQRKEMNQEQQSKINWMSIGITSAILLVIVLQVIILLVS